ncbi:MAG: outer membrane protein transport protein [Gemmatimonadota bacterium]|nr:outer membrane protein transport protein [Gemmatimonadota bacterium]
MRPYSANKNKILCRLIPALILSSALIIPGACSDLHAQSFWRKNDRNTFIRNIQFNFNIPSARAVGLGGAFVAIADDATAGMANPAGLTVLTRPEISIHYKMSRFSHTENTGNTEDHNLRKRFRNDVGSQSYLSFVHPYGKFSFSLYRQELINFESSHEAEGFGSIFDSPNLDPADFEPGSKTRSDIEVDNWGVAMAYKPNKYISLGVSNIVSTLEFRFFEDLFQRSSQTNRPVRIFGVSSNSSDIRYSINVGVKSEPTEFLSLGAVYRSGPKFNLVNTIEDIDESFGQTNIVQADQELVFKVPDVYSAGLALRVRNNLTFSLDVVRVEYSDLIEDLERNLNEDDVAAYSEDFPYTRFVDGDGIDDLVLKDGTEIHFGCEYYLTLGEWLLPLRAGLYTDPSHVVYTTVEDEALQRLFPRGKNEVHGTFGLGFVLENKIQLDAAVNFSNSISEFLLSAVFRF